jgi:hypothetical protein
MEMENTITPLSIGASSTEWSASPGSEVHASTCPFLSDDCSSG